jgi:hypothetical protein
VQAPVFICDTSEILESHRHRQTARRQHIQQQSATAPETLTAYWRTHLLSMPRCCFSLLQ